MIETRMYNGYEDLITFFCPVCRGEDTSFSGMPKSCYRCKCLYLFDVDALVSDVEKRVEFHNRGNANVAVD